jgi:tRNA threonylcarbamoyl adenosine modification protein YjeE
VSQEIPEELAHAFEADGLLLPDEAASQRVAALFGKLLQPGDLVLLLGPLGAGKTFWVRGACVALQVDPNEVTSPTYTLVHDYQGSYPVVHADLYRLGGSTLPEELGLDEVMESGEAIIFVEWPEKLLGATARRTLEVRFEILEGGGRRVRLRELERN